MTDCRPLYRALPRVFDVIKYMCTNDEPRGMTGVSCIRQRPATPCCANCRSSKGPCREQESLKQRFRYPPKQRVGGSFGFTYFRSAVGWFETARSIRHQKPVSRTRFSLGGRKSFFRFHRVSQNVFFSDCKFYSRCRPADRWWDNDASGPSPGRDAICSHSGFLRHSAAH